MLGLVNRTLSLAGKCAWEADQSFMAAVATRFAEWHRQTGRNSATGVACTMKNGLAPVDYADRSLDSQVSGTLSSMFIRSCTSPPSWTRRGRRAALPEQGTYR